MRSNPLFSEIVSSYKARYRSGIRESLKSYCVRHGVSCHSVRCWLGRRGLNVTTLRLEALLESGSSSSPGNSLPVDSLDGLLSSKSCDKSELDGHLLKGVTVTFPDGVIVSIRRCTPEAVEKLISTYQLAPAALCLP